MPGKPSRSPEQRRERQAMLVTSTLRKNDGGRRAAPEQYLGDAPPDEASSTRPGGTSPGSRPDADLNVRRLGGVQFASEHTPALVTAYVGPFTDARRPFFPIAPLGKS